MSTHPISPVSTHTELRLDCIQRLIDIFFTKFGQSYFLFSVSSVFLTPSISLYLTHPFLFSAMNIYSITKTVDVRKTLIKCNKLLLNNPLSEKKRNIIIYHFIFDTFALWPITTKMYSSSKSNINHTPSFVQSFFNRLKYQYDLNKCFKKYGKKTYKNQK